MGNQQFRLPDGTVVTNTAEITRGFKAGFNIMQTAGMGLGSNFQQFLVDKVVMELLVVMVDLMEVVEAVVPDTLMDLLR